MAFDNEFLSTAVNIMSVKPLLGFLSLLACLFCEGAWSQAPPTGGLRAWNAHPDGYPVTEAFKSFIADVDKGTNGKYQIQLFNSQSLGDQTQALKMFKDAQLDVAEFNGGPLSNFAPGLKAFNLPFLFSSSDHMFRHLDGKLGDSITARIKESGFVVLGWYDGGSRSMFCSRPIANIRDLTGLKIRVQQSEIYVSLVKSLGGIPMNVEGKEILDALQTGKIDCAENNLPYVEAQGFFKAAKYFYMTNHVISPEALVVSTRLWDKLTDSEKVVFTTAGKKSALMMRALWKQRVEAARENLSKQGVVFAPMQDSAPFISKMGPLYGKYMADPLTSKELLSIIGN